METILKKLFIIVYGVPWAGIQYIRENYSDEKEKLLKKKKKIGDLVSYLSQ